MQIQINNNSNQPAYQQVINQIKRDIATGKLVKAQKLDTVRDLAVQLTINPNTIAKAYKQLEQEGIITTKPGAGAFVANLDSNLNKTVKKKLITEKIERIIVDAFHMQIDKENLSQWFDEAMKQFNLPSGKGK